MQTIRLCHGVGEQGKSHCVMAATSIVAGEPFSDRPECVCPSIAEALIAINDGIRMDCYRNELLGHLPWLIIGTRPPRRNKQISEPVYKKRSELFSEWSKGLGEMPFRWEFSNGFKWSTAVTHDANYAAVMALQHSQEEEFIRFLEKKIIPVYTTMTVEPSYDERLIYS